MSAGGLGLFRRWAALCTTQTIHVGLPAALGGLLLPFIVSISKATGSDTALTGVLEMASIFLSVNGWVQPRPS